MATFTRLDSDGPVRHLVLDSPSRRNALHMPMLEEIAASVQAVANDPDAQALVVSGEGKAFCAGADLSSLFGDASRHPAEIRADLKQVYAAFLGIAELTIPTLAAVNGVAVGAGVNLAMACDMIVAGPRAKLAFTFADLGLHPGGGCSWFLARRMGSDRALATILGAETLDAEEAYQRGLVTRLVEEPLPAAFEMAHKYGQRDPRLLRDMKRAVQLAAHGDLATVLEFESWAQAASVRNPTFQEHLAKYAE